MKQEPEKPKQTLENMPITREEIMAEQATFLHAIVKHRISLGLMPCGCATQEEHDEKMGHR